MARPKKDKSSQTDQSPASGKKPKARELVAQALESLGENAPNANLQTFIIENHGRKVPITYISHLKGLILGRVSESPTEVSEEAVPDTPKPAPARVSTARPSKSLPTSDDRFLEDIRTLLQLKQRIGAKRFRQLAQLVCFDESPDA